MTSREIKDGGPEWLPIESAPKDGASFLIAYMASRGPTVCEAWVETGGIFKTEIRYRYGHIRFDSADILGWQPMPNPPETSQ